MFPGWGKSYDSTMLHYVLSLSSECRNALMRVAAVHLDTVQRAGTPQPLRDASEAFLERNQALFIAVADVYTVAN